MRVLAIGDFTFTVDDEGLITPAGIAWSVEIDSSRKLDKKAGEKEDDASVTDKGREARSVKVKFTWGNDTESNARMSPIIEKLDPSNPKPGDPPAFAYEEEGLDLAKLKGVRALKVEKAKGPNCDDKGVMTYEVDGCSWNKPKPSPGAGTPAKAGQQWVQAGTTVVKNFGSNGNTVTFPPDPPVAKPGAPKP